VTAAAISGTAARCCQHCAITPEKALETIADTLRKAGSRPGTSDAIEVLTQAATTYATTTIGPTEWYYAAAVELLAHAGADEEVARRRRRELDNTFPRFGFG
jgi:hypothetical protein